MTDDSALRPKVPGQRIVMLKPVLVSAGVLTLRKQLIPFLKRHCVASPLNDSFRMIFFFFYDSVTCNGDNDTGAADTEHLAGLL